MLFSKSNKIQELINLHLNSVEHCVNVYSSFLDMILKEGISVKAEKLGKEITELESVADKNRHQIIKEILDGALLPDLRRELLKLIENVDEIANTTEDISKQILLQGITIPNELKNIITKIDNKEKQQFKVLSEAINKLFTSAKEKKQNLQLIKAIELMESEVDDLENELVKILYNLDISLAEKNQLKVIFSKIADISDIMEDTSDILEMILATRD